MKQLQTEQLSAVLAASGVQYNMAAARTLGNLGYVKKITRSHGSVSVLLRTTSKVNGKC